MNDLQKKLRIVILALISENSTLEDSELDAKISEVRGMPTFSGLTDEEVKEVRDRIKDQLAVTLGTGALIEEKKHEKWFLNRKKDLDNKYWERYRKYLLLDKGFSTDVVNSMDNVLDTLTDLLGDPERKVMYSRKGLIIGDVQSGKTANYTGLICKAVDAGYKAVVLLTGTIEKLRQQTQARIDEGFVGRDSDALMKKKEDGAWIGAGLYDTSISPVCLTTVSYDFRKNNVDNLGFDLRNINGSVIFVVKKNSSILTRLNEWLSTYNKNGNEPIDNSILVIDDEADNASVNTKSSDNPTAINSQIRKLLSNFTKSSYVGFTATPYANIFIDPYDTSTMLKDDLFPKDYIYALNRPSNYIGARDIFSENGKAKDMLVNINEDEDDPESISNILPVIHDSDFGVCCIPDDMKEAIAAFVLANVVQDIEPGRKRGDTHRSMLINASRFTYVQYQLSCCVDAYLKELQGACRVYGKLPVEQALSNEYIAKLKDVYEKIYPDIKIDWPVIQNNLYEACAGMVVRMINQESSEMLDYSNYSKGLRVIAVGGMSLSRGLTLEGLVVSYFYRNSAMYDTLMQMGRWFGYRPGYEDLCRIWMSEESIEWYRYISEATEELLEDIRMCADSGLTPMDFGLKVRSDVTTLLVTANNKMRSAKDREIMVEFSGISVETPELLSDKSKNEINYNAVKNMVAGIIDEGHGLVNKGKRSNRFGFEGVPVKHIIELLEKIVVAQSNVTFDPRVIKKFIEDYKGNELEEWDIYFASGDSEDLAVIPGTDCEFKHTTRRFSVENDGKIFKMGGTSRRIGAIDDATFGLSDDEIKLVKETVKERKIKEAEQRGEKIPEKTGPGQKDYFSTSGIKRRPLLVVYFVGLSELAKDKTAENEKLFNECKDTLYVGFGMGFPKLKDKETSYAVYVINKIADEKIREGEYDSSSDEDESEGDIED